MATIVAHIPSGGDNRGIRQLPPNFLTSETRPPLAFTDDGPGELSEFGPRHDNDHHDFRQIRILPTPDEILAVHRPVYMPKKDLFHSHFLPNGPTRHLDTLFRQLRCDSTEILRDICYSAAQAAFLKINAAPADQIRQETRAGNRYFLYHNIKIEELLSHEHTAMVVRVSYDCPEFMRGHKMSGCGRFKEGMLVALLQLDPKAMDFSVYYMTVSMAQSTFSMDSFGGRGARAAVQLTFPPTTSQDEVLQLCRHALGQRSDCELYLVEFPKVLFAGFYNCLKCLQEMRDSDFSFSDCVAPRVNVAQASLARDLNTAAQKHPQFSCPPPAYATSPNFRYNLSKVVPSTSPIISLSVEQLSEPSTLDLLRRDTTLDEGQAVAFRDSLLREVACTQGPPGCGKTFLGVKIAQTLVESRTSSKPILLICLTNHALDSFLADLRDAGVSGLLRIGSGSREKWTDSINIRNLRRKTQFKKDDFFAMQDHTLQKKRRICELDLLCKAVSSHIHTGSIPWNYVQDLLCNNHPDIYTQFTTKTRFQLAQSFTFEYWSGGGDLESIRHLHVELASRLAQFSKNRDKPAVEDVGHILSELSLDAELRSFDAGHSSVWNMPMSERQAAIRAWETEIDREALANKISWLYSDSLEQEKVIKQFQNEKDVRIMSAHNIIGMTTTACAARWHQLKDLDPEILICEEAAEIMEAHTLCSLLPSLKHAIFIGDPQQLRPETNEQNLSLETTMGACYRLDESLLERLMMPQDPSASALPASCLSVQRRMHPEIANLPRLVYPYLKDHVSTLSRSPTHGIAERMFWWDHRVPELESDDLKSHANIHEAFMVNSLVQFLLRGGAYSQGEIAVLTPYSGQLLRLFELLSATCNIWLCEKDREELLEEDVLALGEEGRATKDEVAISNMLRVATIDNFQGEEAKIVILCTVRSGGRAGFLKSLNRVNVACSRARNGFYIIGNSQTLSQVPLWRQIIQQFSPRIGGSIKTQCHVHPEHCHTAQHPEDLLDILQCPAICDQILKCGHRCRETCHPPQLHERLVCQEPCTTVFDCGHKCPKLCYQTCGDCEVSLTTVTLVCGHQGKCLCSGETSKCTAVVTTNTLACGHTVNILCGQDPNSVAVCQEPCENWLPCQHSCKGICGICTANGNQHAPCTEKCHMPKACIHECKEVCHFGKPCPTGCLESCPDSCEHGPCKNRCEDNCDPCVKRKMGSCEHRAPDMICCLPDLSMPCCQKCPNTLNCGHACPSLCGEMCPPSELCPECATGSRGPTVLYLPECEHLVEVSELDSINLHGIYELDAEGNIASLNSGVRLRDIQLPKCRCGTFLTSSLRYRIHSRLLKLQNVFDLLIAKMGRKLNSFGATIEDQDAQLRGSFTSFIDDDIRPNPLAAKRNTSLLLRRYSEILELQCTVKDYTKSVIGPIQRDLRRLHTAFPHLVPSYTLMFRLHFETLEFRLASTRLMDTLMLGNRMMTLQDPSFSIQRQGCRMAEFVHKESLAMMHRCEISLDQKEALSSPAVEVELRLLQTQFYMFMKSTKIQLQEMENDVGKVVSNFSDDTVKDSLDTAIKLGASSPGSSGSFLRSARALAKLLEPSTDAFAPESIPTVDNTSTRQLEKLWSRHELGNLVTCPKLHVYSSKTFSNECPECEKGSQLSSDDKFRENAKHLFENDFLEAMCARLPVPPVIVSAQPPKIKLVPDEIDDPAKVIQSAEDIPGQTIKTVGTTNEDLNQMTVEERFLAAMHKRLSKSQNGKPPAQEGKIESNLDEESQPVQDETETPGEENVPTLQKDNTATPKEVKTEKPQQEKTVTTQEEKALTMEEKFLIAMRSIGGK